MLIRMRYRSARSRKLIYLGILVLATFLIGIGSVYLLAAEGDVSSPLSGTSSGPIAEEFDMFKARAREMNRQERKEAKKKKPTAPTMSNWFTMAPVPTTDVSDGTGMMGRAGYLAGKTFGRNTSIAPAEVMPYLLSDEHFIFADVRGFVTNYSKGGGSGGLGYRYLAEDLNAWGGASVWYDADQTTSKLFQQVGLSFEGLIQRFELRSNVYIPVTTSQTISSNVSNASIVGNQLLFGQSINTGTAMQGVDAEVGYSLPIQERHVVRGFVGGYHFDGGPVGSVDGVKARVEAVYNNGPTAQLLYTNDKLYGSNLMVGVSFQFPFSNNHPTSGWKRHTPSPFRFVERNYNVAVDQNTSILGNQVATDPSTDKPYQVDFVNTAPSSNATILGGSPPTPDGSAANPFTSIAAAQAAGGNVIIVENGSVLNTPVILTAGQHLLGQGNYSEVLPIAGNGGSIQMQSLLKPATTGGAPQTPLFATLTGSAVTLASNNEVAGFAFSGPSGNGITGTNVTNATIHDVTFLATGGDSIHLTNSAGNVNLNNIQINNSTGNGIVIDQGTANINYIGTGNSITAQQNGFVLSNLTGGTVALSNLTVKGTGGAGLSLSTVGTDVTLSNFTASQTLGPAVAISGNTGYISTVNGVSTNNYFTYTFDGYTTITSPKGAGFTINGTDAIINVGNLNVTSTASAPALSLVNDLNSAVTFNSVTINTNNAKGLYAVGMGDLVINGGTISTVNAPGVDIQSSAINTTFGSISTNGGSFGIGIAQSTGVFNIQGNGGYGSGGTIQNMSTGVLINSAGTTNINWVNFANNTEAIKSTASSQLNLVGLQIVGSSSYAIDSLDDTSITLTNSVLSSNGSIGGGSIRIQADVVGTFSSTISSNNITDANGTAIQYGTLATGANASLSSSIQSNTFTSTRGNGSIISSTWNGPAQMAINNNTMYAYGSFMTAMLVQETSTSDSLVLQANANNLTFESGATHGTGLSVISAGTSQVQALQNQFTFQATGGIGARFALSATTTTDIGYNIITDQSGGATGILFDTVAANSQLQIEGNTINLLSSDLTTHQGIIFTTVTPTIQFSGSANNLIYNATPTSIFSIPVNAATGGIYINGSLVN